MPRDTFTNLPDAKRDRFVEAARDEFAAHGYDQASVSRIVRALGIAKGSVYQYFDDKLDLFRYLVEEGTRRKLAWVQAHPVEEPAGDIWDQLGSMYRLGLGFTAAEPVWSRVLLRSQEPSLEPGLSAVRREHQAQAHAYLVGLLRQGQEQGVVRAEVDPDEAAWLVHGMLSDGLMNAFLGALGTDLECLAAEPLDPVEVEGAMGAAESAVELLRRAFR